MRTFPALLSMIVLALLLVACGSDGEDGEPTAAPVESTPPAEATETASATIASTPESSLATPGTPVIGATSAASPSSMATPVGSPIVSGTPVISASPVVGGTPGTSAITVPGSDPGSTEGMQALRGTVSLPGTINEGFVIADDGCVGLGRYAGVEAGQQVIVRDGMGIIIGVTELAATESAVVCSWTFAAEVPESDYYAVSIPMVQERVFDGEEVAASEGDIELELP